VAEVVAAAAAAADAAVVAMAAEITRAGNLESKKIER